VHERPWTIRRPAFTTSVRGPWLEATVQLGVDHKVTVSEPCLVVVAGLDASLATLVGALTDVPVVAVPTSTGQPDGFAGLGALLTMLSTPTPGVVVSSLDDGWSAGLFAVRLARTAGRSARPGRIPR